MTDHGGEYRPNLYSKHHALEQTVKIAGKTALVTGSGRRVGRALAMALGEAGASVAVHYGTSTDDAEETANTIRMTGAEAATFQADLLDPGQVDRLTNQVRERFGPVEILVNSASMFSRNTLADTSVEEWDGYVAVNVRAPFLLAQAMQTGLADGSPGKIINLGDWRTARRNRFAYGVSKAALSGLTRSLAVAMAPDIQVNEIALGAILPPADFKAGDPRSEQEMNLGPAKRMGSLNEVTAAMLALVHNDFITGETIHVDGGRHIR